MNDLTDLTDDELLEYTPEDGSAGCRCGACRMTIEIRRHRATMKRLEEWAVKLDEPGKHGSTLTVGRAIAAELRNRMRGDK